MKVLEPLPAKRARGEMLVNSETLLGRMQIVEV
jgi:hypothetical protein